MISFASIPVGIRTPGQYVEFDNSRAMRGLPAIAHRILLVGQRLPAGRAPENPLKHTLYTGHAEEAFGRGSLLANMVEALRNANRETPAFAIALDDLPAGVTALGKFTFTGSPTVAGALNLYLGGIRVRVGVTAGMTAAQVATVAASAINANTSLPVTATATGADCEVTFRHKGEIGNSYDLRVNYGFGEAVPAGLTVSVTAMSGGAGNPDIASAIAALGDEQFHTIVVPYADDANLDAIEAELARRWGPMIQREGHAFAAATGTVSTLATLGDNRNSPHLTLVGAGKSPTPPWIWATVTGAVDAKEPDPARPRQTLPLPGCLAPTESERFTREERDTLLHEGVSTYLVDSDGTTRIERLITTYQENASGDADESYLDIETLRTLAYLRLSVRARIAARFPRHKLANDGTLFAPGQAIVTPSLIRGELLHLFREWEAAGLAENYEQFARELIVERNASDPNRVDALLPPDTVNQLRVFAALIQFIK